MELGNEHVTSQLPHLVRHYEPGDVIFKQGEKGQSLFLILSGSVELVSESELGSHTEAIVSAGEFLGEKALLSPKAHRRVFSAHALVPSDLLEIGPEELQELEKSSPSLALYLLKRMFHSALTRLESSNFLLRVLKSTRQETRFLGCLRFFLPRMSKTLPGTQEKPSLRVSHFQQYLEAPAAEIEGYLHLLANCGYLRELAPGRYEIADEKGLWLLERLPTPISRQRSVS